MTSAIADTPQSLPAEPYPRRWAAAVVLIVAALMDLIDVTIVNVALPTIGGDLGASATQLEWVVSAYMLAFAATLIACGRLGDLFGHKRMFLIGSAAFGLASLLSAVAQSPDSLIAARALQGVAAAAIVPQVLATFRVIFQGKERGSVFALYGAIGGFAAAGGLVLGGVLIDVNLFDWGWRSIFVVNLPITIVVLIAAVALVPETRATAARRLDLLGAVMLIAALVAIVLPLVEGRSLGWPLWGWGCVALGVAALVVLGVVDARRRDGDVAPILPTRLFASVAFSAGVLVQMTFFAAMQGFFIIVALWLQSGQRFSALHAGLTVLAFSVGAFFTAPIAPNLAVRFGRYVLVTGALSMAAGIVAVDVAAHHAGAQVSSWALVPGLAVAGAGLGLLVVPLVNVVLSAVTRDEAGEASGVFSTAQQLGGALGVAIIGTIFFDRLASQGFTAAFIHAAPFVAAGFAACGLLALALPCTAVLDAEG